MLKPEDYIVDTRKSYKTVLEMVENSCKEYDNKVVFQMKIPGTNSYRKITYREIWENLINVAKGLHKLVLLPKERVAIYSENRPEWGIAHLGISKAGGIVVPLDAHLTTNELEYLLNHSRARYIFVSGKLLENIIEIFKKIHSLKKIICFDEIPSSLKSRNVITFDELIERGKKKKFTIFPKVRPDDILAILYTSGTTGVSKGVMLTQKNIISDVELSAQMIKFTPKDTFLSVLPIHHSFECTAGFLTPLYRGCTITYAESLRGPNLLANIKETCVTMLLGVPLLFEKLYKGIMEKIKSQPFPLKFILNSMFGYVKFMKLFGKKEGKKVFKKLREKAGMGTLRLCISGGGPLDPMIAEGFETLGITLLQGYGLTETSPVVSVNTEKYYKHASVGLPLPEIQVKIDNPDNEGVGELVVKGPIVMKGYYKNPRETKKVLKNGWLYTGDMAYIDEDGFIYITGRKKNVIITAGGKNVYPEEIEIKLNQSPFILESMVYGERISDRTTAEKVCAIVVPDFDAIAEHSRYTGIRYDTEEKLETLIRKEIRKHCADLPPYKRVTSFRIQSEEFQKTTTRKIKRYLYKPEETSSVPVKR